MKLQLEGIGKSYGSKIALHDIQAVFEPGVYALLGENGAGKSTLIRILVQSLRADSGRILADGADVQLSREGFLSKIGYVPQQQELPRYFTLERFLLYVSALKGLSKAAAAAEIDQVLEATHLLERKYDKIGSLSGGMKQRLLISQALLGDPELLILDEPTAGLDPSERVRIRNLISRVSRERIVLFATHVVTDVECMADHFLFMRKGSFICQTEPEQLGEILSGKVYERIVPAADADDSMNGDLVSSVVQESNGIRIRFVTDAPCPADAVCVPPHLEDLYLYLMRSPET